jgi:hypothetical protein
MTSKIQTDIWQLEQVLVLMSIGIIESCKRGVLSVEDARLILFHPKTLWTLMRPDIRDEIHPDVVDLIRLALELEDTHLFWPDNLPKALDDLQNAAYGCLRDRRVADVSPHFWLHCLTGSEMAPNLADYAE